MSVQDNAFNPSCTRVSVGATVTWNWTGTDTHNVTFNSSTVGNSTDQTTGASFQRTFGTAGTFNYACTRHPGMNGSIQVQ